MEKRTFLCDHCGNEIGEKDVSGLVVTVAEKIAPNARPASAPGGGDLFSTWWRLAGEVAPATARQEKFQFCVECALGLLVGLKARKAHIQKHGRVVRM